MQDAKDYQLKNKHKRKDYYDKKNSNKEKSYQVGDYVLMKTFHNNKLQDIYKGPYEVIGING